MKLKKIYSSIYVCRTTEGPKWEIVFQYQTYAGTDELNMAQ